MTAYLSLISNKTTAFTIQAKVSSLSQKTDSYWLYNTLNNNA